MKGSIGFLFIFISVTLYAQSDYIIQGKLGNYNSPASVHMYYQIGGENKFDSSVLKNGSFQFKGTVAKPTKAQLYLFTNDGTLTELVYVSIFLESGRITITGSDVKTATVNGSRLNKQMQGLRDALKPISRKQEDLHFKFVSADSTTRVTKEFQDWYAESKSSLEKEQKVILSTFIKEHPTEIVSLDALIKLGGFIPEFTEVWPLFQVLSDSVKNSEAGVEYATQLERLRKKTVGEIAPLFTMKDQEGKEIPLTAFRGKYLLIEFWASWCAPCRADNPELIKIYDKFKDRNFTILGVSLDDETTHIAWLQAIKDDRLPWIQVSDLKGWQSKAASLYYVQAIPQNFLISPEGKIVATNLIVEKLAKKLEQIL